MPFIPDRCYRIISHYSERCVERTAEFGVLQINHPNLTNHNQLWKFQEVEDEFYIILACDSNWVLTHHGFWKGPISLSPQRQNPSVWQKWKIVTPLVYYAGQAQAFPNDCYLILTGRAILDYQENAQGQANSCLDLTNKVKDRPQILCEYPIQPAINVARNQIFRISYP